MNQPQHISDVLAAFMRESGLEKPLLEHRIVDLWPEVMGSLVAQLTSRVEIRDGVLFVWLRSAALKAQLFECRFEVVAKLNDAVGGKVIRDIRLLG